MTPEERQQLTARLEILEGLSTASRRLPDVLDLVTRADDADIVPALRELLACTAHAAMAVLDSQLRRWSPSARAELEMWTGEARAELAVGDDPD